MSAMGSYSFDREAEPRFASKDVLTVLTVLALRQWKLEAVAYIDFPYYVL